MSDPENQFDQKISAGGIVMIVISSVGVLTAITTIICLFVTSKRRTRVDSRLQSVTNRTLSTTRNSRNIPRSLEEGSSPPSHVRTVLPMFPEFSEFGKMPPTYDEAMRLPTPTTPNAPIALPSTPRGSPPPAFDEVSIHEQSSSEVVASVGQMTTTLVSPVMAGNAIKVDTADLSPENLSS